MGRNFDELSKALARGESRRATLKRIAAGVAGSLLASTSLRGAQARQVASECNALCRDQGFEGMDFGQCVRACASCQDSGGNPWVTNGGFLCTDPPESECNALCRDQGFEGAMFGQCVRACARCQDSGGTPLVINDGFACY